MAQVWGKLSLLFCQRITYKRETECLLQFLPPYLQACGQQCFSFIGQLFWIPSLPSTGITKEYSQLLLSFTICGPICACVQRLVMFLQLASNTVTSVTWVQDVHVGQSTSMDPCFGLVLFLVPSHFLSIHFHWLKGIGQRYLLVSTQRISSWHGTQEIMREQDKPVCYLGKK